MEHGKHSEQYTGHGSSTGPAAKAEEEEGCQHVGGRREAQQPRWNCDWAAADRLWFEAWNTQCRHSEAKEPFW
jgi:hypothetical protein